MDTNCEGTVKYPNFWLLLIIVLLFMLNNRNDNVFGLISWYKKCTTR